MVYLWWGRLRFVSTVAVTRGIKGLQQNSFLQFKNVNFLDKNCYFSLVMFKGNEEDISTILLNKLIQMNPLDT